MSALTSFDSFIRALALIITTLTIAKRKFPSFFNKKEGVSSVYHKMTVIGERLSIYVFIVLLYCGINKFIRFFV